MAFPGVNRPDSALLQRLSGVLFIGNTFKPAQSGQTFFTVDPGTEEKLCDVALGGPADVDEAVESAHAAFHGEGSVWRQMDSVERGKLLNRLADLLERDANIVAGIEAADSGKPANMARLADVNSALAVLRAHGAFCVSGAGLGGDELPLSRGTGVGLCYTRRSPIGVVAGILPFNFPLCGMVSKIAPAVAAGCTIVLKPSEQCPLSPLYLCTLIAEAGFPPGVINAVTGDHVAGKALVAHPDVVKVSFTGSNAVGREIVRVTADRLARVTLELGGKNSCIVCPGADISEAARIAYGGNYFNSGQICVGISRVLIPDAVYDEFLAEVSKRVQNRVLGDQFDEGVEQGPLVDRAQMERVLGYIEKGVEQGARLVAGGKRHGEKGFFVQPTVLADVTDDNVVAKEEIFGPVMCCQRYSGDVKEAVLRANNTPFGLAAVVVCKDINVGLSVAHQLETGTVWLNTHGVFDPVAPYQGHKQSGLGQEYGVDGVAAFLEKKTIMVNLSGL